MNEQINAVWELVKSYLLWGSVIISGLLVVLTEISKLTKFTPSTKDDLIVMKLIVELKSIKDKVAGLLKK